ncbi:MAG: hypothetical protein J0I20_00100 [Chloroflexi bacterium]|nr:hypothetical protein [Chloroflexota bacterium]
MLAFELPLFTQILCNKHLRLVRNDPTYNLDPSVCNAIFTSFGPSTVARYKKLNSSDPDRFFIPIILSLADRTYGWLAVITARKVLPIWDQFGIEEKGDEDYSFDPTIMLKMAEDFLLGLVEATEVKRDLSNRFYNGVIGLESRTKKQGWLANGAAYWALAAIFQGGDYPKAYQFVMEAVQAYSIEDLNEPGLWWEKTRETERKKYIQESAQEEIQNNNFNNYVPITTDIKKQLDFWEWWLTEAIPQAWDLAHQTKNK